MINPTPRRFRFSLGFLLAWVLLTGLSLYFSLDNKLEGGRKFSLTLGNDRSKFESDAYERFGWPWLALTRREEQSNAGGNEFHTYTREINYSGLAANLAILGTIAAAITGVTAWAIRYARRLAGITGTQANHD